MSVAPRSEWLIWPTLIASLTLLACEVEAPQPDVELGGSSSPPAVTLYPERAQQPTQRMRVVTLRSPSVVAWGELELTGLPSAGGASSSNLALGRPIFASSHLSAQPPNLAVDGLPLSMWNAGVKGESWLELDLGAPHLISELRLLVAQDVPGETSHVIYWVDEQGSLTPVHHFTGHTTHGDWLLWTIPHEGSPGGHSVAPLAGGEAGDMAGVSGGGGESLDAGVIAGATGGEAGQMTGGEPLGGEEPPAGPTVGKWRRHVLSFEHRSYSGQPFALEMNAIFTHERSGEQLTIPAYYDGDSTWRVGFMPTQLGIWRWETRSEELTLDGHSGALTAVASGHPGLLTADPSSPNKWRELDGSPVVPMGLFVHGMLDDAEEEDFIRLADFLGAHHINLINFRLSEHDLAFSNVGELTMNLELWRRLERRLELLTERGVGVDVMFYTDDSGRPSFGPRSPQERLLIRYAIARISSFPAVLFNTGIDLIEYRDQSWVDWFGEQVRSLDPYEHPVSSRYGGGSGDLVMQDQTFNSVGARNSTISELITAYQRSDQIPALNNDNWSEDLVDLNGHTPADLRRAAWKAVISGGVGFSVRHNTLYCPRGITECDRYFPIPQAIELFDSATWLKITQEFIRGQLGEDYQQMHPRPDLVAPQGGKFALADDQGDQLLFLLMGQYDTWDEGDGGPITLTLEGLNGTWSASWLDPRSGSLTSAGEYQGGQQHQLNPPSDDDWVLWLHR